jgi:hypothetical protein
LLGPAGGLAMYRVFAQGFKPLIDITPDRAASAFPILLNLCLILLDRHFLYIQRLPVALR